MLLVIDVGNTNTSMGIYDGARLRASWRLTTRREQTADEWGVFIQTLLGTRGIAQQDITGVAISNVVPPIQQALEWMCERYFGVNPLTVEPGVTADLPLNVDTPREVGADRVVSCVAAIALYGTPLIVVDFGTATRFDCVNRPASSSAARSRPASTPRPRPSSRGPPGCSESSWCGPRTRSAATRSRISSPE